MPEPLDLHEDRFFDPDPAVRRHARTLYDETRALPLVCPHGHVDPAMLADDTPFPEPTALLVAPDHYVLRMLYSRGIPFESLGIAPRDGHGPGAVSVEADPRAVWRTFAAHYSLFLGTPTRAWLDYEFYHLFGVREVLSAETADHVYDGIAERLSSPEYRPRALFRRFGIEVLATTDAATDSLGAHERLQADGFRVIPTFRPDALFALCSPNWGDHRADLEAVVGFEVGDYAAFVRALENRRAYFQARGATATDHGVVEPATRRLPDDEAETVFQSALAGRATSIQTKKFEAHMLMEMARMSTEDGLVMQLHAGALRGHHAGFTARFGPDRGADIPVATEFTRNLAPLLNAYGAHPNLTFVAFTLDESTYARELAPLAGHYPALRLGPPWWFHDSVQGMRRFRERTTETAGLYNTAGFNDDTRAFCSIPARHDLARRMDANWLGGLVARHVIDMDDAREMAHALAVGLARETYRFPTPA